MKLNQARLAARLVRARSALLRGVAYKLGRGGFNAKFPNEVGWDKGLADCSGYVSWVLMIARKPKLIRPFWIETTAVWNDARGKQRTFREIPEPVPGCIVVFPDFRSNGRKHEGHIGIVSAVHERKMYDVLDCTSRGIREHSGAYFVSRSAIFCVLKEDMEV